MLDQDPGRHRYRSTIPATPATSRRPNRTTFATRTFSSPTTSPTAPRATPGPICSSIAGRPWRASPMPISWLMSGPTIFMPADGALDLAQRLERVPPEWDVNGDGIWSGYRPDVWFAFDGQGFDRDPSGRRTGWRAYAYKPLPGAFWPTNGSADDVADPPARRVPRADRQHTRRWHLRLEPRHPRKPDHRVRRAHSGERRAHASGRSRPGRCPRHGFPGRVRVRSAPWDHDELGRPGQGRTGRRPPAPRSAAVPGGNGIRAFRPLPGRPAGRHGRRGGAVEGAALRPQDSAGAATPR